MNCSDLERLVDAHLDGQLSGSLRLEFEAHRVRCTRCQRTLATMEAALHVIGTDRRTAALSDDFTDRVMAAVAEKAAAQAATRALRRRRWTIAAGITIQAAAVIVFAVVFGPRLWSTQPAVTNDSARIASSDARDVVDREEDVWAELQRALQSQVASALAEGRPLRNDVAADIWQFLGNLELPEEFTDQSTRFAEGQFFHLLLPSAGEKPEPVVAESNRIPL